MTVANQTYQTLDAIWYGPFARLADWYHGWRDGRAGIPDPEHRVASTPHREVLIRRAQDAFEQEHLGLEDRRRAGMTQLADLTERRRQSAWRLADAHSRLAAIPATAGLAALASRRYGEQRRTAEVVRTRRAREHHWHRLRVELAAWRCKRELHSVERQLAVTIDEVNREIVVARTNVRRIQEHTHRRLATYRRKLIRIHPQGAWVNQVMDSVQPQIPGWAVRGVTGELLPDDQAPAWTTPPREPVPPDEPQPRGRLIQIGPVTRFGSDPARVDVQVTGYGVAGLHATLRLRGDGYRLIDHNRGEGTFYEGELLRWADLRIGHRFDIGDYRYRLTRQGLLEEVYLGPHDLVVWDLSAQSEDRHTKLPRQRLTRMSFAQRASTVLAVLGPSGAGKSSLFHAVLGELELGSGWLYFSDLDIRNHPAQLRPRLGFVPQDEHVYRTLTVRQVLAYADRLRRPRDRSAGRDGRVVRVCRELGIDHKLDELVGNLSGGQRKRVSIALELLAEPRLLMLDEPTSGLDPARDLEVLRILKNRADRGCTVVVVTHSTEHLDIVDQVLVVASEGRPIHLGPPGHVLADLGAGSWAELMARLDEVSDADVERYQHGEAATEARDAVRQRRQLPNRPPRKPHGRRPGPSFTRQLFVLVRRQIALVLTRAPVRHAPTALKRWYGVVVVGMPLVVAAAGAYLAGLVVGDGGLAGESSARSLSLLVTLVMLGAQALTYSDIVAEYPMIHREHRTGTSSTAVVQAKWLVFAAAAVLQSAVVTVVFCLTAQGPTRSLVLGPAVELFADLAMLGIAAMSLGLLVSVLARKLEQAVAMATAAAIAQVALNGATAHLADRHLALQLVSWLLPARWGLAAGAASIDLNSISPAADSLWRHSTGQWAFDLCLLGALTVLFTTLAIILLRRRLNGPVA